MNEAVLNAIQTANIAKPGYTSDVTVTYSLASWTQFSEVTKANEERYAALYDPFMSGTTPQRKSIAPKDLVDVTLSRKRPFVAISRSIASNGGTVKHTSKKSTEHKANTVDASIKLLLVLTVHSDLTLTVKAVLVSAASTKEHFITEKLATASLNCSDAVSSVLEYASAASDWAASLVKAPLSSAVLLSADQYVDYLTHSDSSCSAVQHNGSSVYISFLHNVSGDTVFESHQTDKVTPVLANHKRGVVKQQVSVDQKAVTQLSLTVFQGEDGKVQAKIDQFYLHSEEGTLTSADIANTVFVQHILQDTLESFLHKQSSAVDASQWLLQWVDAIQPFVAVIHHILVNNADHGKEMCTIRPLTTTKSKEGSLVALLQVERGADKAVTVLGFVEVSIAVDCRVTVRDLTQASDTATASTVKTGSTVGELRATVTEIVQAMIA